METTTYKKLGIALLLLSYSCMCIIAQQYTMQCRGTNRTYLVRLPQNYTDANKYPLLIFLHGGGFTSDVADIIYGFTEHGYTTGYIVVYPQGLNESWSAATDVPFISSLIDTLSNKYTVDKQKIYLAGHSAGAYLVNVLACQLSGKIAAFGDISGIMSTDPIYYKPAKPVPILKIHGTGDNVILYHGLAGNYVSADSVVAFWKHYNNAAVLRDSLVIPDTCTTDHSTVVRYRYGEGSSEVVFYKVINGGHDSPNWAGNNEMGYTNRDISAPAVLWDFFKEHTLNNLTVTYIGNEGFLLQGQEKRVIIDALFDQSFGSYLIPSAFTINRIQNNLIPFDNPDVYLVTHNHGDHFTASMVNEQMQHSTGTYLCGPQDVVSPLTAQPGYSGYSSRIVDLTPTYYHCTDTTINGIKFKILRMHHSSDEITNLGYLFELNGIKILHVGDYGIQDAIDMDTFKLKKENIDIAFIGYGNYVNNAETRNFLSEGINAKHYILMHVDNGLEKSIDDSAAKYSKSMPATVFMRPGDIKTFSKEVDTFFITNTNSCPEVNTKIPDTSAQVGQYFNFKIPAGFIAETNPFDKIEYIATLNNGEKLPDWLKFNSSSQIFTGTPDKNENLTIRISATDSYFANVYDVFKITVSSIVGIDDKPDKGLTIFPNPTTGQISILFSSIPVQSAVVNIFDLQKKQILTKTFQNTTTGNIDLTACPAGIYILKVDAGNEIINQKIIKN